MQVGRRIGRDGKTYLALELANQQALEDFTRLVRVADVLEGFGRVLAADVEHDFLATAGKGVLACGSLFRVSCICVW